METFPFFFKSLMNQHTVQHTTVVIIDKTAGSHDSRVRASLAPCKTFPRSELTTYLSDKRRTDTNLCRRTIILIIIPPLLYDLFYMV